MQNCISGKDSHAQISCAPVATGRYIPVTLVRATVLHFAYHIMCGICSCSLNALLSCYMEWMEDEK